MFPRFYKVLAALVLTTAAASASKSPTPETLQQRAELAQAKLNEISAAVDAVQTHDKSSKILERIAQHWHNWHNWHDWHNHHRR